ncbi:MAG: hypothetical protein ACYCV6_01530 [Steroidobacteraceae bacterium]
MFGYIDLVVFISVLGAAAMLLPTALNWNHMAFTAQVAQVESQQLATITDAALQYEYANSATLDAPNSSHTITVGNLIAQGFLPVGTKATDIYGNPITVQFNADGSGNVTGYVVDQGQKVYSNLEAGRLMLDLGDRGGYMPATLVAGQQPNVIYGSGDTWQLGAPGGISPGSIEVKVEPNAAQEADDSRFLWRVQAPNVSENTMSTPLIMAATEPEGTGCAYTGAIAQDGTGALVSCQGGQWTAVGGGHWKTPVSTYSALPASGNQIGDVRLTEDTDRAFAWNGGSWVALAVNQNGNLHVPNTLTADNDRAVINDSGDGAELNLYDSNGNEYAHIQNAPFGGFLTLKSNSGDDISFVSQGTMMTLWDSNAAQNTWAVHSDGTWEGARGTFCLPGQGNIGQTSWEWCNDYWGWQPQYGVGWSMVTQQTPGNLNVSPEAAPGSINVNDIDVRAGGAYPWYSQLSSQVSNLTTDYNSQQGQINNLNNEYANQQGQINANTSSIGTINSNLSNSNPCGSSPYASFQALCSEIQNSGGSYVGAFGPATQTPTSVWSCHWNYSHQRVCGWTYSSGPASASGASNNSDMFVDGQRSSLKLPPQALLISVTGLVGSTPGGNGNTQGANWGGLTTPCANNGVGASILAHVGSTQVADISLTKTGQPDYITWVTTENTATFVVPAGQSFSIQANSTCAQFKGVVWAF